MAPSAFACSALGSKVALQVKRGQHPAAECCFLGSCLHGHGVGCRSDGGLLTLQTHVEVAAFPSYRDRVWT